MTKTITGGDGEDQAANRRYEERRREYIRRAETTIKELRALRDLLDHVELRSMSEGQRFGLPELRAQLIDAAGALLRLDAIGDDDQLRKGLDVERLEELLVEWRDARRW